MSYYSVHERRGVVDGGWKVSRQHHHRLSDCLSGSAQGRKFRKSLPKSWPNINDYWFMKSLFFCTCCCFLVTSSSVLLSVAIKSHRENAIFSITTVKLGHLIRMTLLDSGTGTEDDSVGYNIGFVNIYLVLYCNPRNWIGRATNMTWGRVVDKGEHEAPRIIQRRMCLIDFSPGGGSCTSCTSRWHRLAVIYPFSLTMETNWLMA